VEKTRLGNYLKQRRHEQGLSVRELQQRIEDQNLKGVRYAQINRIENGSSNPGFDTLQKIAAGLNLPLTILLDGTSEEIPSTVVVLTTEEIAKAFEREKLVELLLYCRQLNEEQLTAVSMVARSIQNYVRTTTTGDTITPIE
jgi:transcriptional regulator with XRE-family HTH domain